MCGSNGSKGVDLAKWLSVLVCPLDCRRSLNKPGIQYVIVGVLTASFFFAFKLWWALFCHAAPKCLYPC